jgi:hypothetical protein
LNRIFDVLNLGAGIQSSRILLASCCGELPKFDAAIFADTQWEPKAVYENVEFLKGEAEKAGIPLIVVTRGNLRQDAIDFRRSRKSDDGKRFASIPLFILNPDGTQGRVKRQCTAEYKIEACVKWIRYELLGLRPRQRMPKGVKVRQWFGISDDEGRRAVFPGEYQKVRSVRSGLLSPISIVRRVWKPFPAFEHVYPLLNEVWTSDRRIHMHKFLTRREQRADCVAWLAKQFPGRKFPRSACLGCPFRSNEEWREMRDERPEEWEDACDFDDLQRQADAEGQSLVGVPYVHRQLVPLRMADLGGDGEKGGGCGTLLDGQDGLCDV